MEPFYVHFLVWPGAKNGAGCCAMEIIYYCHVLLFIIYHYCTVYCFDLSPVVTIYCFHGSLGFQIPIVLTTPKPLTIGKFYFDPPFDIIKLKLRSQIRYHLRHIFTLNQLL